MSNMQQDERYSRQRDIVPAERIAECKATIIGIGASAARPGPRSATRIDSPGSVAGRT